MGIPAKFLLTVICAVALVAVTSAAFGAVTGDLQVRVLNGRGEPVSGARVTIESFSLIGRMSALTGEQGMVRFHAIPPGSYSVTTGAGGLGPVTGHDYDVRQDRTTFVTLHLGEAMVEEVKVSDRPPVLDVTTTSVSHELSRAMMRAIPKKWEYWDALLVVPAVQSPVENSRHPWVHGGTGRDNLYLIDGVNTTDPVIGYHGTAFDYEMVDRHEVTTGGHMPEYGGVVGMTSNVTTPSGGNEWSGSLYMYRIDAGWASDFDPGSIASSRSTAYTTSVNSGGPLLRDRLWLFASLQKVREERETLVPEGAGERPPRVDDSWRGYAKLTWQIAPSHRLQLSSHLYDAGYTNLNSEVVSLDPDQFAVLDQPTRFASLLYAASPADNFTLEALLATFRRERDLGPQYPEAGPNHSVLWVYGQFGRYEREDHQGRDRDEMRVDGNWFLPRGVGEHDIKLGVHLVRTETSIRGGWSGGEKYFDRSRPGATFWSLYAPGTNLMQRIQGLADHNTGWDCRLGGVPCSEQTAAPSTFTDPGDWQLVIDGTAYDPTSLTFDEPSSNAGAAAIGWVNYERALNDDSGDAGAVGQNLTALYAQDDWKLGRWSLRLGMRLEKQRFRNSLGSERYEFEPTISPRLGVVFDPRGDGTRKMYAHFGRIYDPLRDDTANTVGRVIWPAWYSQIWVSPINGYATWDSGGGVGFSGVEVSPELRQQRTDEYLLGYAQAFGDNSKLEITAMHRKTTNGVESFSFTSGLGDPSLYPELQDGPTPESLGFSDRNGDGVVDLDDLDSSVVICNLPNAGRRFDGLDVVYSRRLSNNWQMSASYSWTDFRGTLFDDAGYWGVGEDPDYDPRLDHNDGKLWFPDHLLKVYGSYRFGFGLEIGGGIRADTGSHYGLMTVTPFGWHNWWNGAPARISDTLDVDRDEFSEAWGVPATLPDGSRNPALDDAIAGAVPLELRAGRGAYENDFAYSLDLRLKYTFHVRQTDVPCDIFLDVLNVTNAQKVTRRSSVLATVPGVQVDPTNIGDRDIYTFGTPTYTQSPRSYAVGMRVSF